MRAFTSHQGRAAALRMDNVDTDVMITMDHLLSTPRAELGRHAFSSLRFLADGTDDPAFVLNRPAFRDATILVAGRNFGAGSSREGAVHALAGLGLRVVIASSYGDIFFGNAIKNGLLPVRLGETEVGRLADLADAGDAFDVDLRDGVVRAGGTSFAFHLDPALRERLLTGADEIALTLRHDEAIRDWQARDRGLRPWVWSAGHAR